MLKIPKMKQFLSEGGSFSFSGIFPEPPYSILRRSQQGLKISSSPPPPIKNLGKKKDSAL